MLPDKIRLIKVGRNSGPSVIQANVKSTVFRMGIAVLVAIGCLVSTSCRKKVQVVPVAPATPPPATKPDLILTPGKLPFKFVAYGDIRFSAVDALREREVSSSFARDAIVDAIAKAKPAFVLISGDLVWRGANASDWSYWDKETKPLYDAKIPILPTVGNHEYLTSQFIGNGRAAGLEHFYQRFPDIPHRPLTPWYSAQYANCYFLMLDSVDDDGPGSEQMRWVQRQLDSLSAEVENVFVVLHHPPRTSATDGGHRERLPEIELGKMLEARQQKAPKPRFFVIAGHVHNYERYERNGVAYIVSGGGGAHPHPLQRTADDLFHPVNPGEIEYHYCLFSIDNGKVKMEMYRLADDRPAKFEVRDSFEIPAK